MKRNSLYVVGHDDISNDDLVKGALDAMNDSYGPFTHIVYSSEDSFGQSVKEWAKEFKVPLTFFNVFEAVEDTDLVKLIDRMMVLADTASVVDSIIEAGYAACEKYKIPVRIMRTPDVNGGRSFKLTVRDYDWK